jgi:type IV pilus assembly protein PilE
MLKPRTMQGVTLIELLVAVIIISILAAFAYPSYMQYLARAKRNEAKACLLQVATLQERFYLQNNVYTTDMTNLGFANAGNNLTDSGTYSCNVGQADASTFTATATYQRGDAEAGKCASFSIDGRGQKTSQPAPDCWTNTRL